MQEVINGIKEQQTVVNNLKEEVMKETSKLHDMFEEGFGIRPNDTADLLKVVELMLKVKNG